MAKSIDISSKTFQCLWMWGGEGVGLSVEGSGVEEYLLGLRTDVGFDEDRFLARFFWEVEGLEIVSCFLSGEEGFDFFFAGEFDGDDSGSVS